jgi:Transposase IS66 family
MSRIWSRYPRLTPRPSEPPVDPIGAHYAAGLLADLIVEHGSPRHERELAALLDKREPSAGHVYVPRDFALDPVARLSFDEPLAELACHLARDAQQFAALKDGKRPVSKPKCRTLSLAQALLDQPMLAQVLVAKYCDHLPLYRQPQMFARHGVKKARSTLAGWVGGDYWWLEALHENLSKELLKSRYLFADDTPVPVLDPGRGRTKTGRLWVYARDERPWGGPAPPSTSGSCSDAAVLPTTYASARLSRRSATNGRSSI